MRKRLLLLPAVLLLATGIAARAQWRDMVSQMPSAEKAVSPQPYPTAISRPTLSLTSLRLRTHVISACNQKLPADLQTAGYTTIALCNDWTIALPNDLGTGLPGGNCRGSDPSTCPLNNWFGCASAPDGQNHIWWSGGGPVVARTPPPCNLIFQRTDPDFGTLALDLQWSPVFDTGGQAANQSVIGLATAPFAGGNECRAGQTCYQPLAYFEFKTRSVIRPLGYFPDAGSHCCGPWEYPANTGSLFGPEVDFVEVFPFGWSNGWPGRGATGSSESLNSYHKFGFLYTASANTQGGCPSGFSGGCIMQCVFEDGSLLSPGCTPIGWAGNSGMGNPWYNIILWGQGNAYGCDPTYTNSGTNECNGNGSNASITAIYNCDGSICITVPKTSVVAAGTNENDGLMYPVYISGTGSIDGYYRKGLRSTSSGTLHKCGPYWKTLPCHNGPNWYIVGSAWPRGGIRYSGSGGVLNPYTTRDTYYQYFKIVSCPKWKTGSCALGTIITSELDHKYEGHDYSYAEQQKHPLGRLIVRRPPKVIWTRLWNKSFSRAAR